MHKLDLIIAFFTLMSFNSAQNAIESHLPGIKQNNNDNLVDFTLQDSSGNNIKLSQFRGKFVVLTMEANWCLPCLREIEPIKHMQSDLLGRNIVWVFISFDRDKQSWDEARRKNNFKGIQLWGKPKAKELKRIFNFDSLPFYVWVDVDGSIAFIDAPRPSTRNAEKELKVFLK